MAMQDPSISSLLDYTGTRYTLVVVASKRARQLIGGANPYIETKETKPLSIAVSEVDCGLVSFESPREMDE